MKALLVREGITSGGGRVAGTCTFSLLAAPSSSSVAAARPSLPSVDDVTEEGGGGGGPSEEEEAEGGRGRLKGALKPPTMVRFIAVCFMWWWGLCEFSM